MDCLAARSPAIRCPRPRINAYGDVDLSEFELYDDIPASDIYVRSFKDAFVEMRTGAVQDSRLAPVERTFYLQKARLAEGRFAVNETNRDTLEFVDDGVTLVHNPSWKNHFHVLLQTAFSAWIINNHKQYSEHPLLLPPLNDEHRKLMDAVSDAEKLYRTDLPVIRAREIHTVDSTYFRFRPQISSLLRAFADFLINKTPRAKTQYPKRIYISRQDAPNRKLGNEAEIEQLAESFGFEVLTLSSMKLEDQFHHFYNADIVLGPHGAGLSNMIFCRPGAKIIELSSSNYKSLCFMYLAHAVDLDFELHVFESEESPRYREFTWAADTHSVRRVLASL
jgi:capsular polysaccharide biosynthesis protein